MSFRTSVLDTNQAGSNQAGFGDQDSFSVIDKFSRFDGDFVAERDLRVEGNVKGSIDCHGTLFIAEGALVAARVTAENITVAGDLSGETRCRGRLQLLQTGRVRGRVSTAALIITEGAIYEGDLAMSEAAAPQETPAARPVAVPTQAESIESAPEPEEPSVTPSTFIRRLGGPETPWEESANPESDNS
ncbi:MAG: polymer-forming cytoskeletal protein [Thermomicrobiales bacterium]|nr:polymer-forming cytoskeletal protein [Thermomicrobiales bacterium]MCO5222929.1 polymer-forming cytoskeletal protein [Thermomicrobiales bacterium]